MKSLQLSGTLQTPAVSFNPKTGIFALSGVSRPENVVKFYTPVFDWLSQFTNEIVSGKIRKKNINLQFKLAYYNSASTKAFLNLLNYFHEIIEEGTNIKIDFYYEKGDDQMKEDGEDLSDTAGIPFTFISYD